MGDLEDNLETLFLLEILVDNVQFEKPANEDDLKETCVGFQFLDYPPLIICEEDFVYMGDDEFDKQNVQFKSGKSLLFALPSLQENDPNLGSIHAWVTRRVARSEKTKMMGATDINLTGSFENLLQASAKQQVASPLSKYIRDTFQFKSEGNPVGTITAFLRVSCFGKLIVTQFEVKGKEKFSFKGLDTEKEGDSNDGKKGGKEDMPGSAERHDQGMHPGGQGMNPGGQVMHPGGQEMYSGGQGMYPGGQGMYPGGQVMHPGGQEMYSGGHGMYPGGQGMFPNQGFCPGGQGMFPGQGFYPGGQGICPPSQGPMGGQPGWNRPGAVPGPCPGPNPRLHGKKGVLPCGEPICPTGTCGHFPCSHAELCNCSGLMQQTGGYIGFSGTGGGGPGMGSAFPGLYGPRGAIVDACPADRFTQVADEEIVQATKPFQEMTSGKDSKAIPPKTKGKGKKEKGKK